MQEGSGRVRLVGVVAFLAGAVSTAVVAVDGSGQVGGGVTGDQPTIYGPAHATLAIGLVVAGLLLLVARGRGAVAALLSVIGLCAAQLAGTGLVGFRRWPLFWGCCATEPVTERDLVRTLALVMAVVCAVTAVACVVVLVSARLVRWPGVNLTVVVALAAAVVVAIVAPRLVVGGWAVDLTDLAAWALMYSLPFAAALALSGLMERIAALVTAGAVVSSAFIATLGESHFSLHQPWGDARALVIAAAGAVAATRLFPLSQEDLGRSSAVTSLMTALVPVASGAARIRGRYGWPGSATRRDQSDCGHDAGHGR